jgi:CrcB protein
MGAHFFDWAFQGNIRQELGGRVAGVLTYLWIAIGGALGSMARYGAAGLITGWLGPGFPWGTLLVNVTGSFVIGFFAALTGPEGRIPASADLRQFVMVGICGGYTTFSAFSLQTLNLIQDGEVMQAGLNVAGSVALCLAAVWLGHVTATALNLARAS